MSWAAPLYFLLLIAVVAVGGAMLWFGRRHAGRLAEAFTGRQLERVLPSTVRRRRLTRDLCALAGLLLLVVALAEPRYGKQIVEIERRGVDLVLVVDLSLSMNATDVDPSRLERARREIRDLLELVDGDRLGLVIYAGGAFPRMPLTHDKDALSLMVGELDTRNFQSQGSQLGEALRTAAKLLGDGQSSAGRAVLVLSDGEVHRARDAVAAADELAEQDIAIFGMMIGNEAVPIPLADGTLLQHEGQLVTTEPTMEVLRELAKATGGATVRSVPSNEDMRSLYVDGIRGTLEAASRGSTQQEVWKTGFQWPLGAGLALLLFAAWLGDGRRALRALPALLFALSLAQPSPALAADEPTVADADAAYRSGRWQQAIRLYTDLAQRSPTDPDLYNRLGAARYRAGDFEGASRAWETQLRLAGDDPQTLFNAGNAHYQAGRLEEAQSHYKRVVEGNPNNGAAKRNLDLVTGELELRRQQKPPKDEQGDGEGDGGSGESDEESESQSTGGSSGEAQDGDGEGGEEGSEGEPGEESESAGSDGEQEGESSGDPDKGDTSEGGDGSQSGDARDERSESEGLDPDDLESLEQIEGEGGSGEPGEAQTQSPAKEGEITEQQAEKMLEGVQEGRPRVVIPGEGNKKPW